MLRLVRQLTRWQQICLGFVATLVCVVVLDRVFPPPIDEVRTSVVVTDHEGRWLHGFTVDDRDGEKRWRLAADLEDLDPAFVERLIAIEDKRFWSHPGVDLLAVLRASGNMLRHGEVVSGASTITMQTARLMEPRRRTVSAKLIEMIRAVQIELRLSKEEILELYLTLTPYGGNLQGVRAASLAYFDKEPSRLTDAQQALLIALPQAPEARRPDRRPAHARTARAVILQKLVLAGLLSEQKEQEADEAVLPSARQPFRRLAWHASLEHKTTAESGGEVSLTLDARMQEVIASLVAERARTFQDEANIAALVIDNASRQVRVHVGSANFSTVGGWIDMTRAERSPGSTLKPFIYGLAFEDGFAADETLIDDAPYSFDGYQPENFTRVFHGDVTVSEALQHSLNVPAVLALDRIGPQRFAASLEAAGINIQVPQRADRKASLALALGGAGVSARDLAMLYAGLANDGKITPLHWTEQMNPEQVAGEYQLVSAESAGRLTQIMQEAPAPSGRTPSLLSANAPRIAFKTGTSYGYRDAWAAGYTEDYTVVVWAGHPNGTPRPGITGRKAALPLLFDIFDRLEDFTPQDQRILAEAQPGVFETGAGLTRLTPQKTALPPEIVFPEDGITIYFSQDMQVRGLTLSARGGAGTYDWYVDGAPVGAADLDRRSIWYPPGAGFYRVTVVDSSGRRSTSSVQVLAAG